MCTGIKELMLRAPDGRCDVVSFNSVSIERRFLWSEHLCRSLKRMVGMKAFFSYYSFNRESLSVCQVCSHLVFFSGMSILVW